jgi:hypothetical protein
MDFPQIVKESTQDIRQRLETLARFYTPEWQLADEKDAGSALARIFAGMLADVCRRLNRVPEKHFTAFLSMLGIRLKPAQPTRVPVTFSLAQGQTGSVFIPAGTQVAGEKTEQHPILIFETVKNLSASAASLEEVYFVDPVTDGIYSHSADTAQGKSFVIGNSVGNQQAHELYLGHDELFDLKNPSTIQLKFTFVEAKGSVRDLKELSWCYWGGDEQEWVPIETGDTDFTSNDGTLTLKTAGPIHRKEVNGIDGCWLRCSASSLTAALKSLKFSRVEIVGVSPPNTGIMPDAAFYNTVPLDTSNDFYPFGRRPSAQDTFYIACRDAFAKQNAKIILTFYIKKPGTPSEDLNLSWQYWNGTSWFPLILNNVFNNFNETERSELKFNTGNNFSETTVNGEKNYWVRVCIVQGNYGKEEFTQEGTNDPVKWIITPNFNPPVLEKLTVKYSLAAGVSGLDLQHCLSCNHLEFRDFSEESKGAVNIGFSPFLPLPDHRPTLYLGFNAPLGEGNVSLFFALQEQSAYPKAASRLEWSYWSPGPQLMEDMTELDKAATLTRLTLPVGTELLLDESSASGTMVETTILDSYDLEKGRIVFKSSLNRFYGKNARIFRRSHLDVEDNTGYLAVSGTVEFLVPPDHCPTRKFGLKRYWLMAGWEGLFPKEGPPWVLGIHPNTVWAEQVETIKDEILGSGAGERNALYRFIQVPVIDAEIRINEGEVISAEDRQIVSQADIKEIRDDQGKILETWIRWKPVSDFFDSGPRSRHYIIDGAEGTVRFGNGEQGMIPPIGRNNLMATYRTGGGVSGNLPAHEIRTLKTSITGIAQVVNHFPAAGGADTELLSEVLERGPYLVRHRQRAVTVEDFERLAREASGYIARTKCVVTENTLKIMVIPKGEENKPLPSPELKKIVRAFLLQRSLNVLLERNLEVIDPVYKEIRVNVDVVPVSIDLAVPLERAVRKRLQQYFHPLTGGAGGKGWEFGRSVYLSDVYALLESIAGVDHVEQLKINQEESTPEGDQLTQIKISPFETVCSGNHRIIMKIRS